MKILNFGSLNLDYVYSVDHILAPGETESSKKLELFMGGKGLNQSVALARAGAQVWHAGQIGEEGQALKEMCERSGAHVEFIRTVEGRSGHTIIQVDKDAQNSILLFGGANRKLDEKYIDEVISHFDADDMILMQNEVNMPEYIIEAAYKKGMKIVLNPSPYDSALDKCDMHKVSVFLINEVEGKMITGESNPDKILDAFTKDYPDAEVVLTLGGDGSIYQYHGERIKQAIYKVKAVDTTAAGDTYTGYFLTCRMKGMGVKESLDMASKASSISVTRKGAAPSIPTWDEVR